MHLGAFYERRWRPREKGDSQEPRRAIWALGTPGPVLARPAVHLRASRQLPSQPLPGQRDPPDGGGPGCPVAPTYLPSDRLMPLNSG